MAIRFARRLVGPADVALGGGHGRDRAVRVLLHCARTVLRAGKLRLDLGSNLGAPLKGVLHVPGAGLHPLGVAFHGPGGLLGALDVALHCCRGLSGARDVLLDPAGYLVAACDRLLGTVGGALGALGLDQLLRGGRHDPVSVFADARPDLLGSSCMRLDRAHRTAGAAGVRLCGRHGLSGATCVRLHRFDDLPCVVGMGLDRRERHGGLLGAGAHRLGGLACAGELAVDAGERLLHAGGPSFDVRDRVGGPHRLGLGGGGRLLRAAGARLGLTRGVGRAGGMGARCIGGLLGADREPLDGRDCIGRERRAGRAAGGSAAARGAQIAKLLSQLGHECARLVGALMLVLDGALERLQLGVGVRQIPG